MRIAYLDCFSGISGDMFLGALVDCGRARSAAGATVAALKMGARLEISRVDRSGITATKVDVLADGVQSEPGGNEHEHGAWRSSSFHEHEHSHEPAGKSAPPARTGVSAPHEHGASGLTEIKKIIGTADIDASAKQKAIAIFEALGAAEGKIHNMDIERIHFHEVGAVDAMVDIVCAAVGAEALGVDEIVCSPLNVGGGMVECAHGTFPVPAPATVEFLKGAPSIRPA